MAKILLVDDDLDFRQTVQDILESEHHELECVSDGIEALGRLKIYPYELIVLDWNMPGKDGLEVVSEFRSSGGKTPILMLTGKGFITDRTTGLDAGADDYLTKPFDGRELSSRVRALLRRSNILTSEVLKAGNVSLDMKTFKAFKGDVEIKLLPKELTLLAFLIKHRGQVFSVEDLLNRVWNSESDSTTDAVRQCITRMRRKLDTEGQPLVVVTVTGLGYRVD